MLHPAADFRRKAVGTLIGGRMGCARVIRQGCFQPGRAHRRRHRAARPRQVRFGESIGRCYYQLFRRQSRPFASIVVPIVQRPRTWPFQGQNAGSNPAGDATLYRFIPPSSFESVPTPLKRWSPAAPSFSGVSVNRPTADTSTACAPPPASPRRQERSDLRVSSRACAMVFPISTKNRSHS